MAAFDQADLPPIREDDLAFLGPLTERADTTVKRDDAARRCIPQINHSGIHVNDKLLCRMLTTAWPSVRGMHQ